MIESLGKTEKVVLALLANNLFGAELSIPDDVDWEAVYKECQQQTVLVHTYMSAKESGKVPDYILRDWEKKVISASAYHFQNFYTHHSVDSMMKEDSIPYVILKGCASARYYPKPIERQMGDVDFLVEKPHIQDADQILRQHGYTPWDQEHICHIVYRNGINDLEMHFEPAGIPEGESGEIARKLLSDIIDNAEEISLEGMNMMVPSHFHHGLILLLHTSHHMLGEGIGLRHLCDWAVLVSTFSKGEFESLFESKLKELGIWTFASILTQTAVRYIQCPGPGWTEEISPDITEAMMLDIFTGGNFGRKQNGRVYESYLISNRGKDGVGKRSMFREGIHSINSMVYTHQPNARNNKIRLIGGWIRYGGRYTIRMLQGKRPSLHLQTLYGEAKRRKSIYQKLKLFDRNKCL